MKGSEGAGEGYGPEKRIPQRREVGLLLLGNKDGWMIGSNPSLGVFILLLALCHGVSSDFFVSS